MTALRGGAVALAAIAMTNSAASALVQQLWIGDSFRFLDPWIFNGAVVAIATLLTWIHRRRTIGPVLVSSGWGALFGLIGGIVGTVLNQMLSAEDGARAIVRAFEAYPAETPLIVVGFPIVLLSWLVGACGGAAAGLMMRRRV